MDVILYPLRYSGSSNWYLLILIETRILASEQAHNLGNERTAIAAKTSQHAGVWVGVGEHFLRLLPAQTLARFRGYRCSRIPQIVSLFAGYKNLSGQYLA